MSATGLAAFDSTLHTTNAWLADIQMRTGWQDRHAAYHALCTVLHALRDRLTIDEAAALDAQLPMLVRGFYYEGWHPAGKPNKDAPRKSFWLMLVNTMCRRRKSASNRSWRGAAGICQACNDRRSGKHQARIAT